MNSQISISVAITTYNRIDSFLKAYSSVLSQSLLPSEIIIIDDASPSPLPSYISAHPQTFVHRNPSRMGLAASRNIAVQLSTSMLISFLDDDDVWYPDFLRTHLTYIQRASVPFDILGVSLCSAIRINKHGRQSLLYSTSSGQLKDVIFKSGLNTISSSSVFVREALISFGGYDSSLTSCIDDDIYMSLAVSGRHILAVQEVLTFIPFYDQPTMMIDPHNRIIGISAFCTKWKPTFLEWRLNRGHLNFSHRYTQTALCMLFLSTFSIRSPLNSLSSYLNIFLHSSFDLSSFVFVHIYLFKLYLSGF